jgi:hypothetical protein
VSSGIAARYLYAAYVADLSPDEDRFKMLFYASSQAGRISPANATEAKSIEARTM